MYTATMRDGEWPVGYAMPIVVVRILVPVMSVTDEQVGLPVQGQMMMTMRCKSWMPMYGPLRMIMTMMMMMMMMVTMMLQT
jgi:hypothetical protein